VSRPQVVGLLLLAPLALASGCARETARLSPDQQQRFEAEGIVRRADNLWFRYSHGVGTYRGGWEEQLASIVVTRQSVLIHRNERVLIEVTPRSTGGYLLRRDNDRLSLRTGIGAAARSWAFHPPEDPEGWAADIRAVIRGTAGARRRTSGG
jgi:hypothetical protein